MAEQTNKIPEIISGTQQKMGATQAAYSLITDEMPASPTNAQIPSAKACADTGAAFVALDENVIPGWWWEDPDNPGDFYPYYSKIVAATPPNAGAINTAHGITGIFLRSVESKGWAENGSINLPIPYAHDTTIANQIRLAVDAANVVLDSGANYSTYDCFVFLRYAKSGDTPRVKSACTGPLGV